MNARPRRPRPIGSPAPANPTSPASNSPSQPGRHASATRIRHCRRPGPGSSRLRSRRTTIAPSIRAATLGCAALAPALVPGTAVAVPPHAAQPRSLANGFSLPFVSLVPTALRPGQKADGYQPVTNTRALRVAATRWNLQVDAQGYNRADPPTVWWVELSYSFVSADRKGTCAGAVNLLTASGSWINSAPAASSYYPGPIHV